MILWAVKILFSASLLGMIAILVSKIPVLREVEVEEGDERVFSKEGFKKIGNRLSYFLRKGFKEIKNWAKRGIKFLKNTLKSKEVKFSGDYWEKIKKDRF